MSLRDMVKSYSSGPATATPATPATHGRLSVARVATVAVASGADEKERLAKRWQWLLSLTTERGIHPDIMNAAFSTDADRLDVIEPTEHTADVLRQCMATLRRDTRVKRRQREIETGRRIRVA